MTSQIIKSQTVARMVKKSAIPSLTLFCYLSIVLGEIGFQENFKIAV